MEKETRLKLNVAASIDYPEASEILVSFPDQWELIHHISRENTNLYIAAMPPNKERPTRNHFYGLAPEINLTLDTYRLYRFFQPWPMPSVYASWDKEIGTGRVEGYGDLKVQLQPFGQAQAWFGKTASVLWECYFYELRRREPTWGAELSAIWQVVEKDLNVAKIFTQPHEPTFEETYTDFLRSLGYAPDPAYAGWWSKSSEARAT